MTAPVFDLAAARRNTPNWPPRDGDIWTDRTGREWLAVIALLPGDNAVIGFHAGNTECIPSYALEKYGPLTLTHAGHDRTRYEQLPAEQRARHAAYLASLCAYCGPEGALGDCGTCGDDTESAVAA